MKRVVLLIIFVSLCIFSLAQAPEKMSYQAIIRNADGELVRNSPIGIKISILRLETKGLYYVETHITSTDENGLMTLEIGTGDVESGIFSTLNWGYGPYYLRTEIDPEGGNNYTIEGESNILSVPYALYSKTAEAAETSVDAVKLTGDQSIDGNKTFTNKIIVTQQGIGTAAPNASSALEINSSTQGFLPPRMTKTQRNAITPVEGLMIFNITTKTPNYYDGTQWRNFDGTLTLAVGDDYQGGKVGYILQPGDPGYIPGQTHGLIVTPSDQSTGAEWGCQGTLIGNTKTAIGTGNDNTEEIIWDCTTAGIAAKLCSALILNGYNDWYLPSIEELQKIMVNQTAIGNFSGSAYWSSSEESSTTAYYSNGIGNKSNLCYVRAIRSF